METQNSKVGICPPHFYDYVRLVENEDLKTVLKEQISAAQQFFRSIPEGKYLYKYAEGKWNIKEVLQHIIDAERVFAYRALAFSRNDTHILPSFDDKDYVSNSNANNRKWNELVEDFVAIRKIY
jgi:hypothetical protein